MLSYVARKLVLYDHEEDMGTQAAPYLLLEFGQIYSVRTLEQGEHERLRIKPNDAKRVIQLAYEEGSGIANHNHGEESVSTCIHMYLWLTVCDLLYLIIGWCGAFTWSSFRRGS